MNRLKAKIADIELSDSLSKVKLTVAGITLWTVVIEKPGATDYLRKENEVDLLFKETEVILSQSQSDSISIENVIPGQVKSISNSQLLSTVAIETEVGEIKAIVSSSALNKMQLAIGDDIVALIKINEIMLSA